MMTRRHCLQTLGSTLAVGAVSPPQARLVPSSPNTRRVGVAYSLWHTQPDWDAPSVPPNVQPWGHPLLGYYTSNNPAILDQHAQWLRDAAVDFVLLDWSNTLGYDARTHQPGKGSQAFVEQATTELVKVFAKAQGPRVAFLIGTDQAAVTDGRLQRKADEVFEGFVASGPTQYFHDLGKPLLVVYVNTPSPFQHGLPNWSDPRFCVRWMTGFLTQQPDLLTVDPRLSGCMPDHPISRYGYWSWEDRGNATYTIEHQDGHPVMDADHLAQGVYHPEVMLALAAWRGPGSPGRQQGKTFEEAWTALRAVGPRIALVPTFNEWRKGEQIDADHSKDIEPSREWGMRALDILGQQARLFKLGQ